MKIIDLARSMIELSGLSVRDEATPDGDVEIRCIGLRPGEKLYEELLIGENTIDTPHPKILRAMENALSELETAASLRDITRLARSGDAQGLREVLTRRVDGYVSKDNSARA